jgi:hypothetical protein
MFYEFSIQYDDPIISMFRKKSPVSDVLYFNVTHAYPNWIPPNYPTIIPSDTFKNESSIVKNPLESNNFLTFKLWKRNKKNIINNTNIDDNTNFDKNDELIDYMNLQYHRYIHLFHTYLDFYTPNDSQSQSNKYSISSSILKFVSFFVSKGSWTSGDTPPSPNDFFYRSFPKQSPDLDNDYHNQNPSIFWGWFYLSRWLPDLIQKVLFPLDGVVYNNDISINDNNKNKNNITDNKINRIIPNARKLSGKHAPTKLECTLCERFKGVKIWNKNGEWFCIYKDKFNDLKNNNNNNNNNNKNNSNVEFFTSFSDFINWKISYSNKLIELEKMAYCAKDMNEMKLIEEQILDLKSNYKNSKSKWIKSNCIVSIRG